MERYGYIVLDEELWVLLAEYLDQRVSGREEIIRLLSTGMD